ncbi:MAG: putative entry exclusion protein TrbK-alt [Sphingomonas sp.]|nr:putative entry exclusion protein TrbK-alt [Sphingomonas sp.]
MDGKTLARIGAVGFVALAITATAIDMNRSDPLPDSALSKQPSIVRHDPLDEQLTLCSQTGAVGASDPQCLKAWADNRRRFLGQPPAPGEVAPARSEVR